jgi:hypothetical protein
MPWCVRRHKENYKLQVGNKLKECVVFMLKTCSCLEIKPIIHVNVQGGMCASKLCNSLGTIEWTWWWPFLAETYSST